MRTSHRSQRQHKEDSHRPASQGENIQAKLAIGPVNDPLEHEADRVADQVMSMQETTPVASTGVSNIQRMCADCEEEKEQIQRKPLASFIQRKENSGGITASEGVSQKIQASKGNGNAMDGSTRSFMQSRFGTDFSGVKIHTDGEAIQMNRELNAKAFTVGNDIYFNDGQYSPESGEGKRLLAHELVHTVQQGGTIRLKKEVKSLWTVDDLKKMLKTCDGGLGIWSKAKKANNDKDPTIVPGDGDFVNLKKGEITLDKSKEKCIAGQILVQELSNLSRKKDFEKLSAGCTAGDVDRADYIKGIEKIEYESGVKNVLTAFDNCKGKWNCKTSEKEWARKAKDFKDYYDNFLSASHKESYGQWWDSSCKTSYEKKQSKK